MSSQTERQLDWPTGYDRTDAEDREPYDGDLSLTRKESFQSIVDELERWGATSVDIETASQHYVDRPNIPHQHDKPDDVGVAVRFRHEDEAADEELAYACDRWETQRENARAIALYVRRMRLAEKCGIATGQSTVATARLPGGDGSDDVIVAGSPEPELDVETAADLLGVASDAPDRVVRTAFKEAVKSGHPDQGGDASMSRLKEAREVLVGDSHPD
jgi:hypothetical protein